MSEELDLWVAAGPAAPASARSALDALAGRVPRPVLGDLRLLVSELVTNSVRHAGIAPGGAVRLHITCREGVLRGEVVDDGPGFRPGPIRPSSDGMGGWGLYLLDRLSHRWGVSAEGSTRVWFEIELDRAAAPAERAPGAAQG